MDTKTVVNVMLVALTCALVVVGCGKEQTIPDAQPMPQGADYSGVWYSQQFDHMHLRQDGDQVRGIFTYEFGGRLKGEVDGNLMVFEWVEPGSKEQARRERRGKGYFQLVVEDGKKKLVGEWGYDDNRTGGGPWKAEYVRQLEPEDPITLEKWREQSSAY